MDWQTIYRIFSVIIETLHTRLQLVAIELEEEKSRIIGLLIMAVLMLIFASFGMVFFLVLILLSASPDYRLMILDGASAAFFVFALAFGIFIKRTVQSRILPETRKQLGKDLSLLKVEES